MILHKPKHALACQSCQCFGWKRGKNKVQMPGVIWEKEVMDCSFNIILIAVIMVIYVGNYDFWDMYFAYQIVILLTEIKTCTVVTKQIWKYWLFLPGHEICRWLLWAQQITEEVIIHCSSFAAITAAHLSGIVSKYNPEKFNTNVVPCLLQFKPKAFLWMYNKSVQFIFQTAPNLLEGVEVWTLRGPSFSMFLQIPSIAGSSGNSSFYGYCNGQFNTNNWNLLTMANVLTILATTVYIYIYIYIMAQWLKMKFHDKMVSVPGLWFCPKLQILRQICV